MNLRPYQEEFVSSVLRDLMEYDRVLGVAATGAGKTIMAAELIARMLEVGPCLFLADAQCLVEQAAEKIESYVGEFCGMEMAAYKAFPGDRIVVATTQSIARRLDKWPTDYFKLMIVDEAHRNTIGQQAQSVLKHFNEAQTIGITATPYRSDKRQLSEYYETISCEVGLARLIKEGFLSRIRIQQVPMQIDMRGVRTVAGDYNDRDLGLAIEPHLREAAKMLKQYAANRKTVVFLPLIETSKAFVDICNEEGLRAVHVDGTDRSELKKFEDGEADIIANASLLTTGWDEPQVDCVLVLRPTKSQTLYSQMVGRGTRIHPGKTDLLLLDPLYLSEKVDLIRPARLVAKSEEEAKYLQAKLDMGEADLLEADEKAEFDRYASMVQRVKEVAKRKAKSVDALEFCLGLGENDIVDYEPTMKWESAPLTPKQREILSSKGFDLEDIKCKGQASKIIDLLFKRQQLKLATPKQVRFLKRFGHPDPYTATFKEASEFLDTKFNKKKTA